MTNHHLGNVLIVGASSGIGAKLAEIYKNSGYNVDQINRHQCDLADPNSVTALCKNSDLLNKTYDVCVFMAGMAEAGYIDNLEIDAYRRSFEVNFFSPLTIFLSLARREHPCKKFVFVLSGVAEFLIPGMSPYALSKRALRDFLRILEIESSFSSSKTLTVWPGYTLTEFKSKTKVHGAFTLPTGVMARSPQVVANKIFQAEQAGKSKLVLSPIPNFLGWIQSIMPQVMRILIAMHPKLRDSRKRKL